MNKYNREYKIKELKQKFIVLKGNEPYKYRNKYNVMFDKNSEAENYVKRKGKEYTYTSIFIAKHPIW